MSRVTLTLCLAASAFAGCSGGSGSGDAAETGIAPASAAAPSVVTQTATPPVQGTAVPTALRIYRNPYAGVAWSLALRLKAQHHDHVGFSESRIRSYDAAGYNVLVLLDYSGNSLMPYAVRRRLWPPKSGLTDSFVSSLENIRLFVPGAEEIGDENLHVTSPFLAKYVQRWDPAQGPKKSDEYETTTELRDLIHANDGLAVLAHPWHEQIDPAWAAQFKGMEIYNALGAVFHRKPTTEFMKTDRNAVMLAAWDKALALNPSIVGIAVNDHFGPLPDFPVDDDLRDSGKIIVLTEDDSLEAYRRAFERGAFLAVKDVGTIKDRYPLIARIVSTSEDVRIDTDGAVRWIAMGKVVGTGPRVQVSALATGSNYLRAEIRNPEGSIVFTQAFTIRQVGDTDGDGDVDLADRDVCAAVQRGAERDADRVAACN